MLDNFQCISEVTTQNSMRSGRYLGAEKYQKITFLSCCERDAAQNQTYSSNSNVILYTKFFKI
jgi:hypothetical protein